MAARDSQGNPVFREIVKLELSIEIRVVYDGIKPAWEVFLEGKVPGILFRKQEISDQIVNLWPLSKDPSGAKAYSLLRKLKQMVNEGKSIIQLIDYCKSLKSF